MSYTPDPALIEAINSLRHEGEEWPKSIVIWWLSYNDERVVIGAHPGPAFMPAVGARITVARDDLWGFRGELPPDVRLDAFIVTRRWSTYIAEHSLPVFCVEMKPAQHTTFEEDF